MSQNIRYTKSESARKKLTKQQMKEINKLYDDVYKRMIKKANALEYKQTYSAGVEKLYLDAFQKDLEKEINKISSEVSKVVKKGAKDVAAEVVKENNEILKNFGLYVNGAFSYVPTKAVAQIVNGNVYNGKWHLSYALWGMEKKTIKNLEDIVAKGVAGNIPTKQIARELAQYSKSGNAKYNAMRLARTMSNHAYQKALQMTTEKNPLIEAYKWNNGHADTAVCPLCQELAGKDSFGLGAGVFPKNEVPLDHPNGYCFITCITLDDKDVDKRLIDWVNDAGDSKFNKQLDAFSKDMGFTPIDVKNVVNNNISKNIEGELNILGKSYKANELYKMAGEKDDELFELLTMLFDEDEIESLLKSNGLFNKELLMNFLIENSYVKHAKDVVNIDKVKELLENFVGGGYSSLKNAFSKNESEIKYIYDNMKVTTSKLYRIEDSKYTLHRLNLKVGDKFSFADDIRSFAGGEKAIKNIMQEAIENDLYYEPVIFETVGKVKSFDVNKILKDNYFEYQNENLVGGEFIVQEITEKKIGKQKYKIIKIKQK